MINDYFTNYYVAFRNVWKLDSEQNGYSDEEEISSFNGHTQQLSAEELKTLGMNFTTSFKIWCPIDTNVDAGDTLKGTTGQYSIKAMQKHNIGSNKHLVLYVQLDKNITGS